MKVEVVYARPGRQELRSVEVAPGATVGEALRRSGMVDEFAELAPEPDAVGVFGRRVTADTVLRAGDRIEIYRPLQVEPKAARRLRAWSARRRR